ncbi:sodium:solute symporter family transporter [Gilvimarinus sp. F26214L]|uniref:sodium:solute symporter family transporter n=1 Tax=Gilvimarinus sp. DZF01 TaxID=3461371 RepID=UPI0040453047
MGAEIFKYGLSLAYVSLVFWLSWVGMRRTGDIQGFSIGNKDMNPYLVGMTLAASIASTSTFVINPGFVYTHGLSAYIHYGLAAPLGVLCAFCILTRGFLRLGESGRAATIPEWIHHRYQHRGLSLFFALINLLSITFVVLILVGCSMLMASLFAIPEKTALILTLLFVFSYVIMGGTYAHAYTNTLQGFMMLGVVLFLFVYGFRHFDGNVFAALRSVGPEFAAAYNPASDLYFDFFSVFASGFIITFALMLQPHILTKVLYLRSQKDVRTFIGTTVVVGTVFTLMLFMGFYARLAGVDVSAQDAVVNEYLLHEFAGSEWGGYVLVVIMLALLAAGMSTLDGILVSLSAMVVKDIVIPFTGRTDRALLFSRLVLLGIGVAGAALAWDPPPLIGLFAQKGVYGLAAASLVPILFGVLIRDPIPLWVVAGAAAIGLVGHLYLNLIHGIENPAVSSSYAILASTAYAILGLSLTRLLGKPVPSGQTVRNR